MTDQRIKLVEFMGWKPWREKWLSPDHKTIVDNSPDPHNNANDCDALIRRLNEYGWIVRISIGQDAADVWIETLANECHDWSGDDWKHGVCDLAEKVIDDERPESKGGNDSE